MYKSGRLFHITLILVFLLPVFALSGCGGGSYSGGGSGSSPDSISGTVNGGHSLITSNLSVNLYYYSGGTSNSIEQCTVSGGSFSCPGVSREPSGIYYLVATISASPEIQFMAIVPAAPTSSLSWNGIDVNEVSTAAASYAFGAANLAAGNSSQSFSSNLIAINKQGYSGYILSLYGLIVPGNSGDFTTPSNYTAQNIIGHDGTALSVSASDMDQILGNLVPVSDAVGASYSGNTDFALDNLNNLLAASNTSVSQPFILVLLNSFNIILNGSSSRTAVNVLINTIENAASRYAYFAAKMSGRGFNGGDITSFYPGNSSYSQHSSSSFSAVSETPSPGAAGVPVDSSLSITFNSQANTSSNTVTFFLSTPGGSVVDGVTSYSNGGDTVSFMPSSYLQDDTAYVATVTVTNVRDSLYYEFSWNFATGLASGATIAFISVAPLNPSVTEGSTEQFTAAAAYSDGSTIDVTNVVTWTSSNTSAAAISPAGLATASSTATGSTDITASYGGVTSSPQTLTVTLALSSNQYSNLYSFSGASKDGSYPQAALAYDPSNGMFYGTTYYGGISGGGTIFEFNPSTNTETVVYSFTGASGDGIAPQAALSYDPSNGMFYGTTVGGGGISDNGTMLNGTIFEFNPSSNTETAVYSFSGASGNGDGSYPQAALTYDPSNGMFYGMTTYGGTSGGGTIFQFNPSNKAEAVLYSFTGASGDGKTPESSLTYDASDGLFYGTTYYGGTSGGGTIFEFNPLNNTETVVYSFTGASGDGENPYAALTYDSAGMFYGTTVFGGTSGNGTIFEFNTSSNTETAVYSFTGMSGGGKNPQTALAYDHCHVMIYGTTGWGGIGGIYDTGGTIFEFNPTNNTEGTLYLFGSVSGDGKNPYAAPTYDSSNGILYGTTYGGGAYGMGTIFKFMPLTSNGCG